MVTQKYLIPMLFKNKNQQNIIYVGKFKLVWTVFSLIKSKGVSFKMNIY